jgi:transposase InsO family protein
MLDRHIVGASNSRRHDMNRLPANQKHRPHKKRWQRYEKAQPGHRLQMDVKFLERIPGTRKRLYQFTAIDDCTRIRVLKVYEACNQSTAIQCDEVVGRLPFRVLTIQTDNGPEFQSRFHRHLESRAIRHITSGRGPRA